MSRYAAIIACWCFFGFIVILSGASPIVIIAAIPLYWVAVGMKDDD